MSELSGRTVAEALYNGELEAELRRIRQIEYHFGMDSGRKECMTMVEKKWPINI